MRWPAISAAGATYVWGGCVVGFIPRRDAKNAAKSWRVKHEHFKAFRRGFLSTASAGSGDRCCSCRINHAAQSGAATCF